MKATEIHRKLKELENKVDTLPVLTDTRQIYRLAKEYRKLMNSMKRGNKPLWNNDVQCNRKR